MNVINGNWRHSNLPSACPWPYFWCSCRFLRSFIAVNGFCYVFTLAFDWPYAYHIVFWFYKQVISSMPACVGVKLNSYLIHQLGKRTMMVSHPDLTWWFVQIIRTCSQSTRLVFIRCIYYWVKALVGNDVWSFQVCSWIAGGLCEQPKDQ